MRTHPKSFDPKYAIASVLMTIFMLASLLALPGHARAAGESLSVTPITWNVVGLDSNDVNIGPEDYPIGVRVCNDGAVDLTNVTANFYWDDGLDYYSGNPYINLRWDQRDPGPADDLYTLHEITKDSLAIGACSDFYFEAKVSRLADAYDHVRPYHIDVIADGMTQPVTSPMPREMYVEHLVSQNRNQTLDVLLDGESIPAGGIMTLVVGHEYTIVMSASTATNGYNQIETFINFPNTVFQILGVTTTYTAEDSPYIPSPNDKLYGDACLWDNNPDSPTYRSCIGGDFKAGGNIEVTYQIKVISGSGQAFELTNLIYDFSGSSYHYNSDYKVMARIVTIDDPTAVTFTKSFNPPATIPHGTSQLTFNMGNLNEAPLSGVNFTDTLPAGLTVANASITACGGTVTVTAPDTIAFTGGTLPAAVSGVPGTCSFTVPVTAGTTLGTFTNTSENLFVGTADSGKFAQADLTVNSQPPTPTCTEGMVLARWDFNDTSTTVNVQPNIKSPQVTFARANYSGAGTAAFSTTLGNFPPSLGANGWQEGATGYPNGGAAPYFEFLLDTSKFTKVAITYDFSARNNWPSANNNHLYTYSNADGGGFTWLSTLTGFAKNAAFATNGPIAAAAGDTTTATIAFRMNAVGAKSDGILYLDKVIVTGCGLPMPTISKSFVTDPVAVGSASTLNFTISNTSAVILHGLAFNDTLPAGLTVGNSSSTVCNGGTLTTTAPDQISLVNGSLPAGSLDTPTTCTFGVSVTATTAGIHNNISGYISSTESGVNSAENGIAQDSLTALLAPQISKLFSPNPVIVGSVSTLTFHIDNPNLSDALSGVSFSDVFPTSPASMTVAATQPSPATSGCGTPTFAPVTGAGSINFSNGTIAAGGTCTVHVNVTASAVGTYENTSGNVSAIINGTTATGNTAEASLVMTPPHPDISLLKQVGTSADGPWSSFLAVAPGTSLWYKFTVENTGDVPLSSISVADPTLSGTDADPATCTWPEPLPAPTAGNENHIATCVKGPITSVAGYNANLATATGHYNTTTVANDDTAAYGNNELTLDKTAEETYFLAEDDVLHYDYLVTNTGGAPLLGPVTVADDKATVTCPAVNTQGDLDDYLDPYYPAFNGNPAVPAEFLTCTASYTITADDVAAGSVTNHATASAGEVDSAEDSTTVPSGLATIGDYVWHDANFNGIQDGSESGIDGVTVNLYADDGTTLLDSTTTAGGGAYHFYVAPGTYIVEFSTPTGYTITKQDVPADDAIDSDISPVDGRTAAITIAAAGVNNTIDAGYYVKNLLGDFVWNDLNANGVQEAGEPGLAGVTVNLWNSDKTLVLDTTTTDATGHYSFYTDPMTGYVLEFVKPAGYEASPQDTGGNTPSSDLIDSDPFPATGFTGLFLFFGDGLTWNDWDAGFYQNATIGDYVWEDLNVNGIQDAGEPGIPGVTVELWASGGVSALQTTTTDASGNYSFTTAPGIYYVKVIIPYGEYYTLQNQGANDAVDSDVNTTTGATGNYTLTSGETNNTVDAGVLLGATIGDRVWLDANHDGIQDAGETTGVEGVTVTLIDPVDGILNNGNDVPVNYTTTAADGSYSFTDVKPGTYYVLFTLPSGMSFSPQYAGTDTALDSNPNPATGQTDLFTLGSSETNNTIDAGMYFLPVSMSVTKTADPTSVNEPGGNVLFTFRVDNTGDLPITITSLTDDVFDTLAGDADCMVGTVIAAGSYCDFTETFFVAGDATDPDHVDTFTAYASSAGGPLNASDDATVSFNDVAPTITVTKTAAPLSLNEPGGTVTFSVTVNNTSFEAVTLTSLSDDVYGDLNGQGTCATGGSIAAGGSYSCSFTGSVTGEPGFYTDWVTAVVTDNDGTTDTEMDDATVELTDVAPTITVTKTAAPLSLNEPGGNVTFSVTVSNTSFEAVTLTSLTDDVYGDLNGHGTCATGGSIAAGGSYSCSFTGSVTGEPGSYTDWVTAVVTDNDGTTDTEMDDATVELTDVAPTITVTKTATPLSLNEPGGNVTFSVTVSNTSDEAVDLTTLTDDVYGDLNGHGTCATGGSIAAGGSYSCSFTGSVTGEPGFYTDWVTAVVTDNDGTTDTEMDDATVEITGVAPQVTLVKTITPPATLNEPGGIFHYTITITNYSVEEVTISAFSDDNITNYGASCPITVGVTTLAPWGEPGYILTCGYDLTFTDPGSYPNTASVTVVDDEGGEDTAQDTATATVVDLLPSITIDKVANPTSVPATGGSVTFTFTVTNTSQVPVTIKALTDTVFTLTGDADCQVDTILAVGGSCSFDYTTTLSGSVSVPHTDTFTATVEDAQGNPASNSDGAQVDFTPVGADFGITKTNPDDYLFTGGTTIYTLRVNNVGTVSVAGAILSDPAVPGLTKTSVACSATPGQCVTPPSVDELQSGTFAMPNLDPGQFYEITVTCTVTALSGTVTNTAEVGLVDPYIDNNLQNNTDEETDPAGPGTDLAVTKTDGITTVQSGESTTYRIRVTNIGPMSVTGAILSDPAVTGLTKTLVACSSTPGQCATPPSIPELEGGTFALPALAPGQFFEIAVTVTVTATTGDVTNTVTVTPPTNIADPNTGNNTASDTDTITKPTPKIPSTGFAPGIVTALPAQPAALAYLATNDLWLEIPRLGVKMLITGIPEIGETWDVSWLGAQAGWLTGTAYPTSSGNSVITGHVYLPNGKAGPFVYLSTLKWGDQIIIHSPDGQKYVYEVRQVKSVLPNDASIFQHQDLSWVTLVTCQGYNAADNTYKYRVVVQAVLMSVSVDNSAAMK